MLEHPVPGRPFCFQALYKKFLLVLKKVCRRALATHVVLLAHACREEGGPPIVVVLTITHCHRTGSKKLLSARVPREDYYTPEVKKRERSGEQRKVQAYYVAHRKMRYERRTTGLTVVPVTPTPSDRTFSARNKRSLERKKIKKKLISRCSLRHPPEDSNNN